jgi:hypothetical protein
MSVCVQKGNFLVLQGTNIVIDEIKPRILGIVRDETLEVPDPPTEEMRKAAEEYCYLLPGESSESQSSEDETETSEDTSETNTSDSENENRDAVSRQAIRNIVDELEMAKNEILALQRKIYDLEDVKLRLERIQKFLRKKF